MNDSSNYAVLSTDCEPRTHMILDTLACLIFVTDLGCCLHFAAQ